MKVLFKKESAYVLGYLLEIIINSGDLKFFFFKIWQIWAILLKILLVDQNHVFQVVIWQKFAGKINFTSKRKAVSTRMLKTRF
jgi:hypothetical protein